MKVIINPDEEYVSEIKKMLKSNGGYCPCQLTRSKDTKCKCKSFRDQVERGEAGACHCGLWIAIEDESDT